MFWGSRRRRCAIQVVPRKCSTDRSFYTSPVMPSFLAVAQFGFGCIVMLTVFLTKRTTGMEPRSTFFPARAEHPRKSRLPRWAAVTIKLVQAAPGFARQALYYCRYLQIVFDSTALSRRAYRPSDQQTAVYLPSWRSFAWFTEDQTLIQLFYKWYQFLGLIKRSKEDTSFQCLFRPGFLHSFRLKQSFVSQFALETIISSDCSKRFALILGLLIVSFWLAVQLACGTTAWTVLIQLLRGIKIPPVTPDI